MKTWVCINARCYFEMYKIYNNGNNDISDISRAAMISDAGGGAETRFQLTVAYRTTAVFTKQSLILSPDESICLSLN